MGQPLVEIVVPVYNGAPHLRECLDSVIAQTYPSWNATVVDNCSTDDTGRIADEYAQLDARVRVAHCTEFLCQADNYNRAIGMASPDATYIKIVEADNVISEDSIEKMVALAETDARIGIVGCYSLVGRALLGGGLDRSTSTLSGVEVWRLLYVDDTYILGAPTSLLFRADALRETSPWFRPNLFYDDLDVCVRVLRQWKFGYVHQVLAFIRTDNNGLFSEFVELDYKPAYMHFMAQDYGHHFLEGDTLAQVRQRWEREYYRRLARALLVGRGSAYWDFHTRAFRLRGEKLWKARLIRPLLAQLVDMLLNPKATFERLLRRWT